MFQAINKLAPEFLTSGNVRRTGRKPTTLTFAHEGYGNTSPPIFIGICEGVAIAPIGSTKRPDLFSLSRRLGRLVNSQKPLEMTLPQGYLRGNR